MKSLYRFFVISIVAMSILACSSDDSIDYSEGYLPEDYMPDYSGRYGVRWSLTDNDDLGDRCFAACGKSVKIGIGATPGKSDFDSIYPWSEIKRCNILENGGERTIIYEGEPAFRLDGSNGDVFVRIPKFCYNRYLDGGYEYRVITKDEGTPHPAFVEDGKELDAIYVGAFEGYAENGGLYSRANVIPTTNKSPAEFLELAQNRGEGYTLYDLRTVDLIFTLMAVEFGCRNSGVVLGYGISQYKQPLESESEYNHTTDYYSRREEKNTNFFETNYIYDNKITEGSNICICQESQSNILTFARLKKVEASKKGNYTRYYFDGDPIDVDKDCFIGSCAQSTNWTETCSAPLTWHTGRADIQDGHIASQRNPMRYRWIENIVGNVWHYLPDVTFQDGQMYACQNIKDYEMFCHDGAYKPVGNPLPYNNNLGVQIDQPGNNYWVTSLMCNSEYPAMSFGQAFNSVISSRKAFGAFHYLRDGVVIIANGGGFDHEFRCNILTNRAWIYPGLKWHLYGARLLKK